MNELHHSFADFFLEPRRTQNLNTQMIGEMEGMERGRSHFLRRELDMLGWHRNLDLVDLTTSPIIYLEVYISFFKPMLGVSKPVGPYLYGVLTLQSICKHKKTPRIRGDRVRCRIKLFKPFYAIYTFVFLCSLLQKIRILQVKLGCKNWTSLLTSWYRDDVIRLLIVLYIILPSTHSLTHTNTHTLIRPLNPLKGL